MRSDMGIDTVGAGGRSVDWTFGVVSTKASPRVSMLFMDCRSSSSPSRPMTTTPKKPFAELGVVGVAGGLAELIECTLSDGE